MEEPLHDGHLECPDGRRLAWCEFGTPDGRALLYCHGLPGSRYEAAVFADTAREHGLRIICPDRPGYGLTSPGGPRNLGSETGDVRALIDHLALEQLDLLGFSGGVPHALAIAHELPALIGRMSLVSGWAPFHLTGLEGMDEGLQQLWTLGQEDFAAFRNALADAIHNAGGAFAMMQASVPETDQAILADPGITPAYRRALDESTRQGHTGLFEDAGALLQPWPFPVESINCPAWIFHGDQDRNAPIGMGRWLARTLPGAEYTEWPGASHYELFRRQHEVLDEAMTV